MVRGVAGKEAHLQGLTLELENTRIRFVISCPDVKALRRVTVEKCDLLGALAAVVPADAKGRAG